MRTTLLLLAVLAMQPGEHARVAFNHALPKLDGDHLAVTLVEVTYEPGGGSKPHKHPCPVTGYVVSGALTSNGATYTTGQAFYEAPMAAHYESRNASTTEPVTFLAYFVCDHDTPLTVSP